MSATARLRAAYRSVWHDWSALTLLLSNLFALGLAILQQWDLGVLIWCYARILPIHLTIILGAGVAGGPHALILFLGLKTAADLVMHAIEHAAPEAMI